MKSIFRINLIKFECLVVLFCIYILPIHYLESIFPLDKYLFLFITLVIYICFLLKSKKIEKHDVLIFLLTFFFIYLKRDISYVHLLSLGLAYKFVANKSYIIEIKNYLMKSKFMYVCLIFVFLYSILFFGYEGRYLNTGILDANMSGLAIFCLFVIIRERKKKIGNLLLMLGILTFSKSYLLAIIVYFVFEYLNKKKIFFKINYKITSVLSIVFLILLSFLFIDFEKKDFINDYQTGINRFIVIFDYSNYFRFTVNTNLINIYERNPKLLLTGISEDEFYSLNAKYSSENDISFFRIKPHNYFFSYFRIYGIWSIIIFVFTYSIYKKILNEYNASVSLSVFFYLTFLGIGASNYWLFLTIFLCISKYKYN